MQGPIDGRYVIERELGAGAQGLTVLARAPGGEQVVVKLLHAQHVKSHRTTARFGREVATLGRLQHPHVVPVLASGVCAARGQPYYVMPYVPGASLDKVLEREGRLPLPRALRLMDQLLDALEAVHAHDVVHRDLKPGNLLIEQPGAPGERVRVIDFTLAKSLAPDDRDLPDLTGRSTVGTPLYMSPEQCTGAPITPAADIYAVGCILTEVLAGRPPFEGETPVVLLSQHVMEDPPRLDALLPGAPPALAAWVAACLDKDPPHRPTAGALRAGLRAVLGGGAAPPLARTVAVAPPSDGPVELVEGAVLGGYRLEKLLGQGGQGAVFLTHLPDGRKAALKALLPAAEDDPMQTRRRFVREVRLLRSLVHPNLPAVYDQGTQGGVDYALFEFIPGQDLGQRMRAVGRMSPREVLTIMRQVCPALDFAHCRGVIHCDLKPGQLRLRDDGRVFVLDLGISRIQEGSALGGRSIQTQEGVTIGTPEYLPPELYRGRQAVAPASDVYSLGVILFEALAGRLPFEGATDLELIHKHLKQAPPDLAQLAPEVPPAVRDIVMTCLAKSPAERFPTAGLLLRALEEALAGAAPPVRISDTIMVAPPGPTASLGPATYAGPTGALRPGAPPPRPLGVGLLSGRQAGAVHALPAGERWVVGRDAGAAVRLAEDEAGVSRAHAVISRGPAGLSIADAGSAEGTYVEGVPAGDGLPLARGAVVQLGATVLALVDEVEDLRAADASPPALVLRRADRPAPLTALDGPRLLGRGHLAVPGLIDPSEASVSAAHCSLTPRLGRLVLEDAGSNAGTFVNGVQAVVAVLRPGDEVSLGPGGPRFRVEAGEAPGPAAAREPLADTGDATRAHLQVAHAGRERHVFLFAGTRLRFGRNRARDGVRQNDLLLRAFPRGAEDPAAVEQRTRNVSGHHGTFVVTQGGVAIVDDGSTLGTRLDGRPLVARELTPLPDEFQLELVDSVALRGRVLRAGGRVAALRLERLRDGEHHAYVLVVREATLGAGTDDAVVLPAEGVSPAHARLTAGPDGVFAVTCLRPDAPVAVAGRGPLGPGASAPLRDGDELFVGAVRLRVAAATDDDFKR